MSIMMNLGCKIMIALFALFVIICFVGSFWNRGLIVFAIIGSFVTYSLYNDLRKENKHGSKERTKESR